MLLFVATVGMIFHYQLTRNTVAVGTNAPSSSWTQQKDTTFVQLEQKRRENDHRELLIGYKLLYTTLRKESMLEVLYWWRTLTLRGPPKKLKGLWTSIYRVSKKKSRELKDLWMLQPTITIRDAPESAMRDSLAQKVEDSSKAELLLLTKPRSDEQKSSIHEHNSNDNNWEARFVLIQAQATRMIVSIARSIQKFESNERRTEWLEKVAQEYERLRDMLVEYCV